MSEGIILPAYISEDQPVTSRMAKKLPAFVVITIDNESAESGVRYMLGLPRSCCGRI